MRQLIHVAYKLAALKMDQYYRLLEANEKIVSECVYENIYDRHICRLFDIEIDIDSNTNSDYFNVRGGQMYISISVIMHSTTDHIHKIYLLIR